MAHALLPRCATLADARSRNGPRLLILLLVTLFAAGVTWAGLATIEQVVRATGQVEPEAHLQVVNHPRGGRIAEVVVAEGQSVPAGAVLARLDPQLDDSALAELAARRATERARIARLEAELGATPLQAPDDLAMARPDLVAEAEALLLARRRAFDRRLAQLISTERQRAMELAEQEAQIRRLEQTLVLLKEEAGAVAALAEKGLAPRLREVTIRRRVADAEGELAVARSAAEAARAAEDEAAAAQARLIADRESDLRLELARARAEGHDLEQAVLRQAKVVRDLAVRAPVAGIVKDIAVTSPGQSFAAYAPLLTIVPTDGPLVVEAKVPQQEIGRLQPGQDAVVKVMAFDYLRYGTLDGRIVRIAADASTEERTGEVVYTAVVATGAASLERNGVAYPLVPGMLVDVELIVGERSILSFLTDRILMLGDEAFREG